MLASHPYTAIVRRDFARHISLAFLVFFAPAARPFFADETGSWVPTGPDGGNVNALSLDPSSPLTVYAGTGGGVFRTRDAGAHWTHVGPKDVSVNDLAVSISEPSMVYAATAAGLFRSDDGGTSWRRLQVAAPTESIDDIELDSGDARAIYVSDGVSAVWTSRDAGETWTRALTISSDRIVLKASDPQTIYAATAGSLRKSIDAGTTWSSLAWPLPQLYASPIGIAIDPRNRDFLYVGWVAFTARTYNPYYGLIVSRDRGLTWNSISGHEGFVSMVFDPRDPARSLQAGPRGIYRSVDGGQTFTRLSATTSRALAIDSRFANVWLGTRDGVFVSGDLGVSWIPLNKGLHAYAIYSLQRTRSGEVVATGPDSVFRRPPDGGWINAEGLPASRTGAPFDFVLSGFAADPFDGTRELAAEQSLIPYCAILWRDGDGSWTESHPRMPVCVHAIIPDRGTRGVFYALGFGIFKTTDSGESWSGDLRTSVLSLKWISTLAIDPADSGHLLVSTLELEIFESKDSGVHWQRIGLVPGYRPCSLEDEVALRIDPTDSRRVYAIGRQPQCVMGIRSFLKSEDGGVSWEAMIGLPFSATVTDLIIDPTYPRTLYAATSAGVYRSNNAGRSFFALNEGLTHLSTTALEIDPSNRRLLVATDQAGVFERDLLLDRTVQSLPRPGVPRSVPPRP